MVCVSEMNIAVSVRKFFSVSAKITSWANQIVDTTTISLIRCEEFSRNLLTLVTLIMRVCEILRTTK